MDQQDGKKFDKDKVDYSLITPEFDYDLAAVLTFGAKKYEVDNWKKVPNAKNRYYAALQRHLCQYRMGEKADEETGESHLMHAACCLMFLHYLED